MRPRRLAAPLGAVGSLVGIGADLILVLVVVSQDVGQLPERTVFVAIYLGLVSLVALTGSVMVWQEKPMARALLVAPGINFAGLGVPAIFSIGYLLLFASLLTIVAAFIGGRPPLRPSVAFTFTAAIVLGCGFYLTR